MRVVQLTVPTGDGELAADRLWAAGAQAVEEIDDDPAICVLRTVLAEADAQSSARLGHLPEHWVVSFVDVDERPAQTWREFAQPIHVSPTLIIRPAWQDPVEAAGLGVLEVPIEPGAAFGLGDHPTTRLCAAAVERHAPAARSLLDVGCGTGVLGVIAALLGVPRVDAIDIAEAAVEATIDNAVRNGVSAAVTVSTTSIDEVTDSYDVVVANILAPALVTMAEGLRTATAHDGVLVLSGLLTDRFDHVVAALQPMRLSRVHTLDGWVALELAH